MYYAFAFLVAAATTALSATDRSFLEQAMTGNTSEIRQGQIFADSTDPLIQSFSKRMIQDHSAANTQLIAFADSHGIHVSSDQSPDLPAPAATHNADLSAEQKANAMKGLTPVAYFTQQVRVHQQAVALYKHEIASGTNPQMISYAKQTLPTVESHLALAQRDLRQEQSGHHG
jgi:putative membrane protein